MPIEHPARTALLLALVFVLPIREAKGASASFPLHVSADRRYLEDGDGKPFLVVIWTMGGDFALSPANRWTGN